MPRVLARVAQKPKLSAKHAAGMMVVLAAKSVSSFSDDTEGSEGSDDSTSDESPPEPQGPSNPGLTSEAVKYGMQVAEVDRLINQTKLAELALDVNDSFEQTNRVALVQASPVVSHATSGVVATPVIATLAPTAMTVTPTSTVTVGSTTSQIAQEVASNMATVTAVAQQPQTTQMTVPQMTLAAQQVAVPAQQVATPAQQVTVPAQQVVMPAQQVAVPVQQVPVPVQQVAMPVQQVAMPAQQVAMPQAGHVIVTTTTTPVYTNMTSPTVYGQPNWFGWTGQMVPHVQHGDRWGLGGNYGGNRLMLNIWNSLAGDIPTPWLDAVKGVYGQGDLMSSLARAALSNLKNEQMSLRSQLLAAQGANLRQLQAAYM